MLGLSLLPDLHGLLPATTAHAARRRAVVLASQEPPEFRSRSTARVEEESFAEGTKDRRDRLHAALEVMGVDVSELTESADLAGSAALRLYTSFIHPKNAGALANAEKPQRATTIARSIAFQLREQRAFQDEWLRNHDRALSELPATRFPLLLILDNVRSAANVGNILRAAEAARVQHVHCCGITPTPPNAKVLKTALGAAAYVPHSHHANTLELVRELKAAGVTVWAAETTSRSVRYSELRMPQPLALVLGNELIGVDTQVQECCDELVMLPCHGVKNSLNVATACSVLLWEALRQWDE